LQKPTNTRKKKMKRQNAIEPRAIKAKSRLLDETGDVPGWVLITLMTAGLVVLMWTAAGPALKGIFDQAMTKVVAF
jgi:hypothetical protein